MRRSPDKFTGSFDFEGQEKKKSEAPKPPETTPAPGGHKKKKHSKERDEDLGVPGWGRNYEE